MKEAALLGRIAAGFASALGDNLIGVYLHGSLAFGCYHRATGDIDLLAVVRHRVPAADKMRLLRFLLDMEPQAPPKGIEMSVVLESQCAHMDYPTPYELHFSPAWAGLAAREPHRLVGEEEKTDYDLAAHFMVVRKAGIALLGPPALQVFGPVPEEYFAGSIWQDVKNAPADILENPVYVLLNLCRALAFFKEKQVLSKAEGGRWLAAREPAFAPLIEKALACYRTGAAFGPVPSGARAFAAWAIEQMNEPD